MMISRRQILLFLSVCGLSIRRVAGQYMPDLHPLAKDKEALPPHNLALSLVWRTQQDVICKLELRHATGQQKKEKEHLAPEERWWFDTDNRQWTVRRPIAPGTLDSTHWFSINYLIDGKSVGSWFVDTRKEAVKFSER